MNTSPADCTARRILDAALARGMSARSVAALYHIPLECMDRERPLRSLEEREILRIEIAREQWEKQGKTLTARQVTPDMRYKGTRWL